MVLYGPDVVIVVVVVVVAVVSARKSQSHSIDRVDTSLNAENRH